MADLKLRWLDGKMVRLEGRLSAKVIQACVVTLDPVMAEIDAGFTRMFSEAPPMVAPEVTLDLEQDGPDPIEKGQIDLGEIVAEELALSLDPYPRGPDVVFPMARLGNGPKDGGTGA